MQRRNFIRKSVLATTAVTAGIASVNASQKDASKEFYELRTYDLRWGHAALDSYFTSALIPALNKAGVKKVGAFSELSKSEPGKLYLFIPYASMEDFQKVAVSLKKDADFAKASTEYNKIPPDQAAFSRYDSSFMIAFDGLPKMIATENTPRIFELRTYEGYSDDALRRKIKMFNEGEFPIFYRSKLNPVFFGEVIAGKNLPCLTYMITFKSMADHDAAWKAFLGDPDWEKMKADPQYANTVSLIHKTFLEPTSYSQI